MLCWLGYCLVIRVAGLEYLPSGKWFRRVQYYPFHNPANHPHHVALIRLWHVTIHWAEFLPQLLNHTPHISCKRQRLIKIHYTLFLFSRNLHLITAVIIRMRSAFKSWIDDYVLLNSCVDRGGVLVVVDLDHVVEDGVHVFF